MAYLPSCARSFFTRWSVLVVAGTVHGRSAGLRRGGARSSGRDFCLPRTPPGALARHDLAAQEQLAAPDSPRLTALQGAGEARDPDSAPTAHGLGGLNVGWGLREEQVRLLHAGQVSGGLRHRHLDASDSLPYRPGSL